MANPPELLADLSYLEQADAHADEGPLGEPAARSILAMALKYARQAARTTVEPTEAMRNLLRAYERATVDGIVTLNAETMEAEEAANAALATLRTAAPNDAWQPIETAPRDETAIFLWFPEKHWRTDQHIAIGFRGSVGEPDEDWFECEADSTPMTAFGCAPTYWQPLPAAPKQPRVE